ncbi:uncharacterized protein LOC103395175 isoform X3 [Cynoglossus semilaevis]|uniref:uncharacterized protein LOC103395175 isoform X3 n=1 Tax=Cynoglossus semilaevis TaxID=244447 RepID=UPI0007DC9A37|nr:uncharacterized protein LOC103395175 isoform X3 [Cynoglossus semilaevis]
MSESCTNKTMDSDIGTLPDNVNPGTFPAKLWRLVSNPENTSICWDQLGFQYYPANILTSHMAGSGLQLRPFAPYHCYQMAEKLMPPPTNSLSVKLPNPETADNGFHHINQEIITDNYLSHDTHRMDSGGPKSTEVLDVKHGDPARFDSSMAPDSSTSTPMQACTRKA